MTLHRARMRRLLLGVGSIFDGRRARLLPLCNQGHLARARGSALKVPSGC